MYRTAQRFRSKLIKHENSAVRQTTLLYDTALYRLQDDLRKFDDRIARQLANGEPQTAVQAMMRTRLLILIDETEDRLSRLAKPAADATTDAQRSAVRAVNAARNEIVLGTSFAALDEDAIETFVGFSSGRTPLAELFQNVAKQSAEHLRMTLVTGLARGTNPVQVVRELMGVANISRSRAETIARTEMLRAAREAQRTIYADNDVMFYQRVATQDARVCLGCLALSGTIHPTSDLMPSHPNCRCVMVPMVPGVATIDHATILQGLDEDEKRTIFGAKRWELYNNGTPIADMVGVRNNAEWGPSTYIVPLRRLGGGGTPKPPKPQTPPPPPPKPKPTTVKPKPVRKPRPVPPAPAAPGPAAAGNNRDPQWLLQEMRRIAGTPSQYLSDTKTRLDQRIADALAAQTAARADPKDKSLQTAYNDAITELQKQAQAYKSEMQWEIDADKRRQMLDLFRSSDPLKPSIIRLGDDARGDAWSSGQVALKGTDVSRAKDVAQDVLSYIDRRPYTGTAKTANGIDVDELAICRHDSSMYYGYYQPNTNQIALSIKVQPFGVGGINYKFNSMESTLAHEMAHWLDARDSELRRATEAFFAARTAGDVAVQSMYKHQWMPDLWPDQYCGVLYSKKGVEIPTRGIQFLLEDPLAFAETDFEYFSYVVEHVLGHK